MSDVTGPISTLPGSRRSPPKGTMCDQHADRPAVARVQGETDSFGCEMHDLCADCVRGLAAVDPHIGVCDWCKTPEVKLRPRRDIDEGSCGPVYYVCKPCADRDEESLRAELAEYDDWDD